MLLLSPPPPLVRKVTYIVDNALSVRTVTVIVYILYLLPWSGHWLLSSILVRTVAVLSYCTVL